MKKKTMVKHLVLMGVGEGCYVVLPVLGPINCKRHGWFICKLIGGDPWYNVTVANELNIFLNLIIGI